MDPLTHTLLGATLAETRLARDVRLGRPALIVGANLADIDALSLLVSMDFGLGFRRGWTHGVLADLGLPLILWCFLVGFDRWRRRRGSRSGLPPPEPVNGPRLLALCYLGVLTHPLLDWLNTYGVRLLMPFDGSWYYGDALFIIDPWLWLVLGGSLFLSRAGRSRWWWLLAAAATIVVTANGPVVPLAAIVVWVVSLSMIIAARRIAVDRLRGPRTAVVGLVVAGVYIAVMIGGSVTGKVWVRDELQRQGLAAVGEMMVGPVPADPFRRDVLVEVPGGYRHGTLALAAGPRLELQTRLLERPDSPALDATLRAPQLAGTVNWMRFPFAEILERPDGYTVYLLDARYVRRRTNGFGSAVLFLQRNEVIRGPRQSATSLP